MSVNSLLNKVDESVKCDMEELREFLTGKIKSLDLGRQESTATASLDEFLTVLFSMVKTRYRCVAVEATSEIVQQAADIFDGAEVVAVETAEEAGTIELPGGTDLDAVDDEEDIVEDGELFEDDDEEGLTL